MRLYFSAQKSEGLFSLVNRQPPSDSLVTHEVDLADRVKFHNFHAYPMPIVQGPLSYVTESIFLSQPFEAPTVISGSFTGELTADHQQEGLRSRRHGVRGHAGRKAVPPRLCAASRELRARTPRKRRLLSPGKTEHVKFETTMVSRQMLPGSRLLVLVDAIKNPIGAGELRHRQGRERRVGERRRRSAEDRNPGWQLLRSSARQLLLRRSPVNPEYVRRFTSRGCWRTTPSRGALVLARDRPQVAVRAVLCCCTGGVCPAMGSASS